MFHPFALHQNLSKQHSYIRLGGGGGGYLGGSSCFSSSSEGIILGLMSRFEGGYDYCSSGGKYCLGQSDLVISPIIMAEDESRIDSVMEDTSKDNVMIQDQENNNKNTNDNNSNEDWLQLSIGGRPSSQEKQDHEREELVELNLLPGSSSSSGQRERLFSQRYHSVAATIATQEFQMRPRPQPVTHFGYDTSSFLQYHQQGIISSSNFLPPAPPQHLNNQETNWVYRPMSFPRPTPLGIASSSSSPSPSSSFIMPPGAYFSSARTPFQLFQTGQAMNPSSMSSGGLQDMNFRVINPPRRPHSGIWFMLQASQNQAKEPFLPQIPKSYLRIKDGRMTIRLVMKYLVNKLRLGNESQVEITCRGQHLVPFLTLEHVRDNIWNHQQLRNNSNIVSMTTTSLLPESSTIDHIMVLHYARTAI